MFALAKAAKWAAQQVAVLQGGSAGGAPSKPDTAVAAKAPAPTVKRRKAGKLGVIRLDYSYPPAPGDIDSPESYGYEVVFRVVPGLTFEMVQSGKIPPNITERVVDAVKYLEDRGVSAITGDCGFMLYLQKRVRQATGLPVAMSSLVQMPAINSCYSAKKDWKIAIFTANSVTLEGMHDLINRECGLEIGDPRFAIVGCQNVPGFQAVANGKKVDVSAVQPGIVKLAKEVLQKDPAIKCIVLECTELPAYADALRAATGLPVYDAITCCDFAMSGVQEAERFGMQGWQFKWDGQEQDYSFGENLTAQERAELECKPVAERPARLLIQQLEAAGDAVKGWAKRDLHEMLQAIGKGRKRRQAGKLGVIRLDYNYPPAPGDIDSVESYGYEVLYRVVPGLTFEMVQSGIFSKQVKANLATAIQWLDGQGVSGITGDCGFMLYLQEEARQWTTLPVYMSSLVQLPTIHKAYSMLDGEQIAIFTANSNSLEPMRQLILDECGINIHMPGLQGHHPKRFLIVGCQDVAGFEAVAEGGKVDTEKVQPGIVALAQKTISENPRVKCILLECTELPPYANALRAATGLPVYDAITACNFFMSGVQDNERFGLQNWQECWDGHQEDYKFAMHLNPEEKAMLCTAVE